MVWHYRRTDGRPDGRGVLQYPRFFFEKREDNYIKWSIGRRFMAATRH